MTDETTRKNKGGRPRTVESGSKVSAWIPSREHDQLIRLAERRGDSVSALLRRVIARALAPRDEQ